MKLKSILITLVSLIFLINTGILINQKVQASVVPVKYRHTYHHGHYIYKIGANYGYFSDTSGKKFFKFKFKKAYSNQKGWHGSYYAGYPLNKSIDGVSFKPVGNHINVLYDIVQLKLYK